MTPWCGNMFFIIWSLLGESTAHHWNGPVICSFAVFFVVTLKSCWTNSWVAVIYSIIELEWYCCHGPLTRYAKLRVAHVPWMPGKFSPAPQVSDPDIHHGMCMTHMPWCMPGLLTSGFIWIRWRGKCSRHSRRMCNLQFCLSGKRPMALVQWQCSAITDPALLRQIDFKLW